MLRDAHRQAALDIERAIGDLGDPTARPYLSRSLIELYWGAAFQWIAYGCERKHGKHKENHTKLVSYLRGLGETSVSDYWDALEKRRAGGFYGTHAAPDDVRDAEQFWREIRTWALS